MKKNIKAIAFILIIVVVLSFSIGLENKPSLQLKLTEIEAESSWELMNYFAVYSPFDEATRTSGGMGYACDGAKLEVTKNSSNQYILLRFDHDNTSVGQSWSNKYITEEVTYDYSQYKIKIVMNVSKILNTSDTNLIYVKKNGLDIEEYVDFATDKTVECIYDGFVDESITINGMLHGKENVNIETRGVRVWLYCQKRNIEPAIALIQPSSNSPLQGRQAYRKGAA